jgi:ADP-heptose:LPS heptosyltransferase
VTRTVRRSKTTRPSRPARRLPITRTGPVVLPERARILVVKAAGIGDLLLAVPALRALRAAYPQATLDVLTTPQSAPLLRDSPLVNRVIPLDKIPFDYPHQVLRTPWRLAPLLGLWREIHAARYDAVLLLHHLTLPFGRLKYRLLLAAARPALTVGLDNGHGAFLDVAVPDAGFGARHEAEYCLTVAAAVGAPVSSPLPGPALADLGWENEERKRAVSPDGPVVALHLGSGSYSRARRWPLDRYVALAHVLRQEFGVRIVLVGGPDDDDLDTQFIEALRCPAWITPAASGLDLRATARLLAHSDLFIGNDSLPMHLAAAAGTPVVAIFGPSNHRAWAPLKRDAAAIAVVVRRDLPCSPCFYRGHTLGTPAGCPPRPCLTELGIDPPLAAARRALRARIQPSPDTTLAMGAP